MIKTNFHTHTVYCDGKDTPEELVEAALAKSFSALGFSGHSYFEQDMPYVMDPESERKYIEQIRNLKQAYAGKLQIFCGIEQDLYSAPSAFAYDYVIGSVHYVHKDGAYLIVDGSLDEMKEILSRYYDDDFDAFAKDYFAAVALIPQKTNADIIGHFDLILKCMDQLPYTPTEAFFEYAEEAVLKLIPYHKPFEINTGAMARGYRTTPYPHRTILKMIFENGGSILISSDCHDKDYLDYGFEVARTVAREVGFTQKAIITEDGIAYIPL